MSKHRVPDAMLRSLEYVRRVTPGEDVMFVDPGSGGTGWSIFHMPLEITKAFAPTDHDVLRSTQRLWHDKFGEIAVGFSDVVLFNHAPDRVVYEWPQLWGGSQRSYAAATDDDLFKLCALIGALELAVLQNDLEPSLFITPSEWKGQMSKAAVNDRIFRMIGQKYPNHVSDAVGMGLAVQGGFRR